MKTFAQYMVEVDEVLERLSGVTSDDLGDYTYRDAYDAGEDPEEVAVSVLEANDFDFVGGDQ